MMTDLVDQHMRDDGAESFLVLGPVIEDGTAIEPNLIGQLAGERIAGAPRQAEFW